MALGEALLVYVLILVWAALLGWLPFRLLEYISIVDRIDVSNTRGGRAATSSHVVCLGCGKVNDRTYTYCGSCGAKLPKRGRYDD